MLASILLPFHKQGAWEKHNSTATSAPGVGHSAQSFWGLADMGQIVSLMFITTLEEASWHENMNLEPKELALHSVSCSHPCELFLLVNFQRCHRGEQEAQATAPLVTSSAPCRQGENSMSRSLMSPHQIF